MTVSNSSQILLISVCSGMVGKRKTKEKIASQLILKANAQKGIPYVLSLKEWKIIRIYTIVQQMPPVSVSAVFKPGPISTVCILRFRM